jgi:hypothetical protein
VHIGPSNEGASGGFGFWLLVACGVLMAAFASCTCHQLPRLAGAWCTRWERIPSLRRARVVGAFVSFAIAIALVSAAFVYVPYLFVAIMPPGICMGACIGPWLLGDLCCMDGRDRAAPAAASTLARPHTAAETLQANVAFPGPHTSPTK